MDIDVSDEAITIAKDYLKLQVRSWEGNIAKGSYMELGDNPTVRDNHYFACHAWVATAYRNMVGTNTWCGKQGYSKSAENFLVLSCVSVKRVRTHQDEEAFKRFVLWVARDTTLSKYVLNRDDEESLFEGGVILYCGPDGLSHAQAMWLCKALRLHIELGGTAKTWADLVDNGVHPMVAFFCCSSFSKKTGRDNYTFNLGWLDHPDVVSRSDVVGMVLGHLNKDTSETHNVFSRPKALSFADKRFDLVELRRKWIGFSKPVKKPDGWGGFVETVEGLSTDKFIGTIREMNDEILQEASKYSTGEVVLPLPDRNTIFLEVDL